MISYSSHNVILTSCSSHDVRSLCRYDVNANHWFFHVRQPTTPSQVLYALTRLAVQHSRPQTSPVAVRRQRGCGSRASVARSHWRHWGHVIRKEASVDIDRAQVWWSPRKFTARQMTLSLALIMAVCSSVCLHVDHLSFSQCGTLSC